MFSIYKSVIAVDNSLADLIVTKKLLEKKGITDRIQLICVHSESLPLMPESFNALNIRSVLGHVEDQDSSLYEVHRVLKKRGILLLETPSRFTFHKEPHVKVSGIGFVLRKRMKKIC
jgi:ubiquinone/menaquinone biosynthesis C-methylase UbiE